MNKYIFEEGVYRVVSKFLRLRTTTEAQLTTNYVRDEQGNEMRYKYDETFPVFAIVSSRVGWTWGLITPLGQFPMQFCCLWDKQTQFAELLKPFDIPPVHIAPNERGLLEMYQFLIALGYKGQPPF